MILQIRTGTSLQGVFVFLLYICVCAHVCVHMCVCVCVCVCFCVILFTYTHLLGWLSTTVPENSNRPLLCKVSELCKIIVELTFERFEWIHVSMSLCIFFYVHVCICMDLWIYLYMYLYVYVFMCIGMDFCFYVCSSWGLEAPPLIYVTMYLCIYLSIFLSFFLCM